MKNALMKTSMLLLPTLLLAACGGGSGGGAVAVTTTPTTSTTTSTTYLGVAAGGGHTVAIKKDGTKSEGPLLAWGLNRKGQVGDGTSIDKAVPTQVGVSTAATGSIVSAGEFHTMALSSCGTSGCALWAWGSNDSGRLGDGTGKDKSAPTTIKGTAWTAVAAGGTHTLAIKKDSAAGGTLWVWGRNDKGQLGLGASSATPNYDTTTLPAQGGAGFKTWTAVSAGALHSLAIYGLGSLAAWGANNRGQLGINSTQADAGYVAPAAIASTLKVASISAGGDHSLAILNDGTLWAWGANGFGQVGNGTIVDVFAPVKISTSTKWESISAGGGHNDAGDDQPSNGGHSLAIHDGELWAWGSNTYGQLGTGTTDDATSPTRVGSDQDWVGVSAGKLHSVAQKQDGSLWMWGNNLNGQLGNGSSGTSAKNILVPTRMP